MHDDYNTAESLRAKRDKKAKPHLSQYAPIWIVDERLLMEDESIQFNVVFHHAHHGWVNRRYRYDGFNDVLYQKGQTVIHEDDAVEITEHEPYIDALAADTPNAYGG